MEKKIAAMFLVVFFLGGTALFAEKPGEPFKESGFKQVAKLEGRGWLNILTCPAELVYTLKTEPRVHPKAWPATYIPRFFGNIVTRLTSGINDVLVLPWGVPFSADATPLTRRFDLPDYVWQKDL